MPLPNSGLAWPPAQMVDVLPALYQWGAWYSGDPALLELAYGQQQRPQGAPANRPSTYRGGVVGAVARTFWGAPRTDLTQAKPKLHVPIAADLCSASADLLFSEPPAITSTNNGAADRLDALVGDGMLGTLSETAELAAALGSGYLRVTWDRQLEPDGPFLTSVDADGAWPEFRWGRLTGVTFWTVLSDDGSTVWRHLERHELDGAGNGIILHGLYQGTRDNLGRLAPITEQAATAGLADQLTDGQVISTESPGLAVVFVPNQRPQRRWRHDPLGRNLGRSDLDGVESLMDSLDETYTSWMRDIRLGKARVFVADSLLDSLGPGNGSVFDSDQEIFSPLHALGRGDQSLADSMDAQQFAIRYEEHAATADALTQSILRTAGYSAQTFGLDESRAASTDTTATEIQSRERRSYMTRDVKIRFWRPALVTAVQKLLAVDNAVFGKSTAIDGVTVTFSDGVQDSPATLAATASVLAGARLASTKTLISMIHPDWDDTAITKEVAAIAAEKPAPPAGLAPGATSDSGQAPEEASTA